VGRWLGGPYSIPTYIVMCESGGNYGALNPSSGAGGAYQVLPSTWESYGGQGAPHEAPKAEQDRIAAEIWADSGGSAWVCAG
jgi:muramidase (phage lysozyme)